MPAEGWVSLLAIGAATYLSRAAFIVAADRVSLPAAVRRGLRFIPIAVLTAIAAPAIVDPSASGTFVAAPARVGAAAIAGLVAWRARSLPFALAVGLALLLALQVAGAPVE
jgi:branched-subunit amino acid transport protein